MKVRDPKLTFLILAVVCIGGLSFAGVWVWELSVFWAGLIGVNASTLLFYGADKSSAVRGGLRIPEIVLHLLALLGGSPAALLGQILFRHKIRKMKFRIIFILIVLSQMIGIFFYIRQSSL